jgi:pyruvate/2-oxoglutarate dehydrogenase complex dihydrolipoamide acyltransferase (E2) component
MAYHNLMVEPGQLVRQLGAFDQTRPQIRQCASMKVNFPKSGMGIEEGTVVRWAKSRGERVQEGELLVEIETAKAVQEVEAPVSGTLIEIIVTEGSTVAVNTTLAIIEEN